MYQRSFCMILSTYDGTFHNFKKVVKVVINSLSYLIISLTDDFPDNNPFFKNNPYTSTHIFSIWQKNVKEKKQPFFCPSEFSAKTDHCKKKGKLKKRMKTNQQVYLEDIHIFNILYILSILYILIFIIYYIHTLFICT
jgi:hypothetical protein